MNGVMWHQRGDGTFEYYRWKFVIVDGVLVMQIGACPKPKE